MKRSKSPLRRQQRKLALQASTRVSQVGRENPTTPDAIATVTTVAIANAGAAVTTTLEATKNPSMNQATSNNHNSSSSIPSSSATTSHTIEQSAEQVTNITKQALKEQLAALVPSELVHGIAKTTKIPVAPVPTTTVHVSGTIATSNPPRTSDQIFSVQQCKLLNTAPKELLPTVTLVRTTTAYQELQQQLQAIMPSLQSYHDCFQASTVTDNKIQPWEQAYLQATTGFLPDWETINLLVTKFEREILPELATTQAVFISSSTCVVKIQQYLQAKLQQLAWHTLITPVLQQLEVLSVNLASKTPQVTLDYRHQAQQVITQQIATYVTAQQQWLQQLTAKLYICPGQATATNWRNLIEQELPAWHLGLLQDAINQVRTTITNRDLRRTLAKYLRQALAQYPAPWFNTVETTTTSEPPVVELAEVVPAEVTAQSASVQPPATIVSQLQLCYPAPDQVQGFQTAIAIALTQIIMPQARVQPDLLRNYQVLVLASSNSSVRHQQLWQELFDLQVVENFGYNELVYKYATQVKVLPLYYRAMNHQALVGKIYQDLAQQASQNSTTAVVTSVATPAPCYIFSQTDSISYLYQQQANHHLVPLEQLNSVATTVHLQQKNATLASKMVTLPEFELLLAQVQQANGEVTPVITIDCSQFSYYEARLQQAVSQACKIREQQHTCPIVLLKHLNPAQILQYLMFNDWLQQYQAHHNWHQIHWKVGFAVSASDLAQLPL